MNQSEWLACNDPRLMIEDKEVEVELSDRHLNLFSVACYYQIREFLPAEGIAAVEAFRANIYGEIGADALSDAEELLAFELFDGESVRDLGGVAGSYVLTLFADDYSAVEAAQAALKAVDRVTPWRLNYLARTPPDRYEQECAKVRQNQMAVLADRLREIVRNSYLIPPC